MGVEPEIRGYFEEGSIHLEVEKDSEGILVGKYGRTLEALETLINRMVNRRVKEPVRSCVGRWWLSKETGRVLWESWPAD